LNKKYILVKLPSPQRLVNDFIIEFQGTPTLEFFMQKNKKIMGELWENKKLTKVKKEPKFLQG
jgi:hypothetical protein